MKKFSIITILSLCAFAPKQENTFKKLSALTGGSWQMKMKKGILGERWTQASSTELQSRGFKINGRDTTWLEQVSLVQKADGIYYISIIQNQNGGEAVPFKLTKAEHNRFEFTNPQHDFPQRVVYELVKPDSLHAWIDGTNHGTFAKQEFFYKRVND